MKVENISNYNTQNFYGAKKQTNKCIEIDCSIDEYINDKDKIIYKISFKDKAIQIIKQFIAGLFKKENKEGKLSLIISLENSAVPAKDIKSQDTKKLPNIPAFPSKPFTNAPTPEQKKEYVDSLLKYIAGNKPSVEDKVRAINEINKYGIDNLDKMIDYLSDDIDDEIIQATLQTFAKWGNQKYANRAICPFLSPESSLTSRSKTYIEALKTVQKLADLSDYTEKEREDVFYRPIRRLLNHSDEKVRAMAQETLDKIAINK